MEDPLGVQYFAQGHFDMWTVGAENRNTDPPIGGQPLYTQPPPVM